MVQSPGSEFGQKPDPRTGIYSNRQKDICFRNDNIAQETDKIFKYQFLDPHRQKVRKVRNIFRV